MRKIIALGALLVSAVAVTAGLAPAADAAAAQPAIPTCLISNGGDHGHFNHTLTCVDLIGARFGHAGSGRYSPGEHGRHTLTVTLEFRHPGRGPAQWVQLASATDQGFGDLQAVTPTRFSPPFGQLRACVSVDEPGHRGWDDHHDGSGPLCTSA